MSATRKRDLRSGRSIWEGSALVHMARRPLRRDRRTDALVIGAGISGALVADQLSDAGLDVTIIDRRGPVRGSTVASTALIQHAIDTPLSALARHIGTARAERIWRRSKLAVDALRERASRLSIRAAIRDRRTLYLDGPLLDREGLRVEADARRRAGFDVVELGAADLSSTFGIRRRAGLLSDGDLEADPRRLAAGFVAAAISRHATLHAPVEAVEVRPDASDVTVRTATGPTIRARHVVFATGYELAKGVPRKGHKIASTWAMSTPPRRMPPWPDGVFIWEAADPYLYLRTGPGNRVICGGEDAAIVDEERRDALLPAKTARLQRKLGALLPHLDARVERAWCGSFGSSATGTPSIGPVPGMRNCYAVMGFGGNGITFSMVAAQLLRGLITGNGDTDADLFSFTRSF